MTEDGAADNRHNAMKVNHTHLLTSAVPDQSVGDRRPSPTPFHEDPTPPGQTPAAAADPAALILALDSYEGPIDLLLEQARGQKVDLSRISVTDLADQFIAFIEAAQDLRIELAADYLVMAAWLAYLKSRLLLPSDTGGDDEPTGAEMAAALTYRLQRLNAMRAAGDALMSRRLLGRDWWASGGEIVIKDIKTTYYSHSLYDLLKAYADHRRPRDVIDATYDLRLGLVSVDEAVRRMTTLLGVFPGWNRLEGFLPKSFRDKLHSRSAVASHFVAALELAKAGAVVIRQERPFAPIYLRSQRRSPTRSACDDD